ncbi:MAG: hypothetical protein LIO40_05575 [Ruminococcus sp.]|nr:hypothetical protein [Ruminococcus sp.]
MYKITSAAVIHEIEQYSRTFRMLMEFSDGRVIEGSAIGETTVEHTMSEDDTIPIGKIFSKRVEMRLYTDETINKGDVFTLYLYLICPEGSSAQTLSGYTHGELAEYTHAEITELSQSKIDGDSPLCGVYMPFGEFVAAKVVTSGIETTLTAYDRLQSTDRIYYPQIDFPANASAVLDDILDQLGIEEREAFSGGAVLTSEGDEVLTSDSGELLCSGEYEFTVDSVPTAATCREMLCAIMAIYGRNGIINRDGAFTTVFIGDDSGSLDTEKIDEPEIADENVRISGIRCTVSDDSTLEVGDPDGTYAIEIECPYMTRSRLFTLWARLASISWRPGNVSERIADPRRELGDMLTCRSFSIPITSLIFHFDGGLYADISACGQLDEGV